MKAQNGKGAGDHDQFPGFDGLRAIAATTVLVIHASILSHDVARRTVGLFLQRMDVGVVIFFVISGFLLYRPFVLARLTGGRALTWRQFYRRRALRIFPAYWVALVVIAYVLVQTPIVGKLNAIIYFSLGQIYDPHLVLGGLTQAWSLCTEISFYALLPLYGWVLGRGALTPDRQLRREWIAIAALFVVTALFTAWVQLAGINRVVYNWLPAWLDMFALGMGLAVASAAMEARVGTPSWTDAVGRHPGVSWLLAVVAFVLVSTTLGLPVQPAALTTGQQFGAHYLYGIVALLVVVPAVFGPQDRGVIRALLRSAPFAFLGLVSYGIYLWHVSVLVLIEPIIPESGSLLHLLLVIGGGLALTALVALVSYLVIERPALSLKRTSRTSRVTRPKGHPGQ